MTMRTISHLGLTTLLALAAAFSPAAKAQSAVNEMSTGGCVSFALGPSEDIMNMQRTFLIDGPHLTAVYRYFEDAQCRKPMYSMTVRAEMTSATPSKLVAGAMDTQIRMHKILFTLDSPRGAARAKGCGDGKFELGTQKDVSKDGCLHLPSIAQCPEEYELVHTKDGVVTTGFRTPNMCSASGRPTRLHTAGVRFVERFTAGQP